MMGVVNLLNRGVAVDTGTARRGKRRPDAAFAQPRVVACRARPLSDHENLQGQTKSMTQIFNFRSGHCDWKTAGPTGLLGA